MLEWQPGGYCFWYPHLGSSSILTVEWRHLQEAEKKGLFKWCWQWCSTTWEDHSWERGHVLLTLNKSNEKPSLTQENSGSKPSISLKWWLNESFLSSLQKISRSVCCHNLYSVAVIKLSNKLWTAVPILLKELNLEGTMQEQFNYSHHWHANPTLLNLSSISLDKTLSQAFWCL